MDPIGKSPIPVPLLIAGKVCLLFCWLFFFAKSIGVEMLYESEVIRVAGILIAVTGLLIIFLGFVYLGKSVSVGLPREKTELKTGGIYRYTRNPLYLGAFLICIGSCLHSVHLANFIFCVCGILIHHRIVLREEIFLEGRFGEQWLDYKKQAPRYIFFLTD